MAKTLIENDLKANGCTPCGYNDSLVKYICNKYTKAELAEKIHFMNVWYEGQQNRAFKLAVDMEIIPGRYYSCNF